ncbi:hypothetical protein BDY21DRAFT_368069 [Lineolata rhizophorae]|uniref:Uncharacterized protein n=1 Tax=Lineolata rhizophorae TaxID=578093 RepID=A0A6A6PDI6_9PEZI|nr:hypothetical protein BDY21DRAFT_368069 [Lineolata rhizophorae]
MAHQMSPPAQQLHQQPGQPQRSFSPQNPGTSFPPSKRPKLSPNPPSPYPSAGSPPSSNNPFLSLPHPNPVGPITTSSTPQPTAPSPPSFHAPQPFGGAPGFPAASSPSTSAASTVGAALPRPPFQQSASHPSPATTAGPTIMGPPQRPAEKAAADRGAAAAADKPMDVDQLTDAVTASGIDLKAEENYLALTYMNKQGGFNSGAQGNFGTPGAGLGTQFGSQQQVSAMMSPSGSTSTAYEQLSAAGLGQHAAFAHSGHHGAAPHTGQPERIKSPEEEQQERSHLAARAISEHHAQHLRDPFLEANVLRHLIHGIAFKVGVRINVEGCYDKVDEPPQNRMSIPQTPTGGPPTPTIGPNGAPISTPTPNTPVGVGATPSVGTPNHAYMPSKRPNGFLRDDAPLVEILSLLSLAANDRMRSVLEDAFALARARRYATHGVVPPEWDGIAEGVGKPESATAAVAAKITGTAWDDGAATKVPDSAVSPMTKLPMKRPFEATLDAPEATPNLTRSENNAVHLPTPATDASASPQPTHAYPPLVARSLHALAARSRRLEEARLDRRAKRQKRNADGANGDETSANGANADAEDKAAQEAPLPKEPKMTKKERERLARMGPSESEMHKQANNTAQFAMSRLGIGGKKFAWMNQGGAGGAGPGGKLGVGKINTAVGGVRGGASGNAGAGGAGGAGGLGRRERKWGEWREDVDRRKGVQVTDWILAMELEGRDDKELATAYAKLKNTWG